MEPGLLLLLLLLTAPWGRGWATSRNVSEEAAAAQVDGPSVRLGKPGKYHETNLSTTNLCNNVCSSKCVGGTGCGQECQQANEGFHPWIDTDPTTNCMNKCRVESNCRGNRKYGHMRCLFHCLQLVPARLDSHPKKKVPHIISCCNSTCSSDTNGPSHLPCCSPLRRSSNFSVSLFLLGLDCRWFSDPRELCYLAPEHGLCKRHIYCYAYIPASRSCRLFVFRGCRGNANNLEKCQQVCEYGLNKR